MPSDDQVSHIEIHDEQGRRINPPEGVVYESVSASMPAEPAGVSGPAESDECVFCEDTDWQWIITPRPGGPGDDTAWAPYLVTCDICHDLYSQGRRDELRERVEAATGPYWILPELDQLLDRIIAERHR
jgi:hypothetical protein